MIYDKELSIKITSEGRKNLIDLEELERRVDDALAKETKESLIEWLKKDREKNKIAV